MGNASLVAAKVDHAQKTGVLAAQNLKLEKVRGERPARLPRSRLLHVAL
jgi:hypothetical protein